MHPLEGCRFFVFGVRLILFNQTHLWLPALDRFTPTPPTNILLNNGLIDYGLGWCVWEGTGEFQLIKNVTLQGGEGEPSEHRRPVFGLGR